MKRGEGVYKGRAIKSDGSRRGPAENPIAIERRNKNYVNPRKPRKSRYASRGEQGESSDRGEDFRYGKGGCRVVIYDVPTKRGEMDGLVYVSH